MWPNEWQTDGPTDRSNDQPTNQQRTNELTNYVWLNKSRTASQPDNQQASQAISRPANKPANQLASETANQPGNQPAIQPAIQPVSQTANHPASQPASQRARQSRSTSRSSYRSTDWPTHWPTDQLQGTEVILRKLKSRKLSRIFPHFVELAVSVSFSQDLAAGRYPQQDESNPSPLILFFKLYFIIILPSIPWSCKRFFFRAFPPKRLHEFVFSSMHVACLSHLTFLHSIIQSCVKYKSWSLRLYFSKPHWFLPFLSMFSNDVILCSSHNATHHVNVYKNNSK